MAWKPDGVGPRPLEQRLAAMLCYLLGPLSGIVVLSIERQSRFVRFHALQCLLYSTVVLAALTALVLAELDWLVRGVILLAIAVWFGLIVQVARGRWSKLPILGWLAERNA